MFFIFGTLIENESSYSHHRTCTRIYWMYCTLEITPTSRSGFLIHISGTNRLT